MRTSFDGSDTTSLSMLQYVIFYIRIALYCYIILDFSVNQSSLHSNGADYQCLQLYARCDELLSRVETWRCRIEPLLELETERHSFDIREYAAHFLDGLGSVSNEIEAVEEGANDKFDAVPFEQVLDTSRVAGSASKFEVCRYFLATLQLANHGNVEIVDGQSGLHLRLLDASLCENSELEM